MRKEQFIAALTSGIIGTLSLSGFACAITKPLNTVETGLQAGWTPHQSPVSPLVVIRHFDAGDSLWAAGKRAIDVECDGGPIHASAPGSVSFVGPTPQGVAVSINHIGNFQTTFTKVIPKVKVGDEVGTGDAIATCSEVFFNWSARIGKKRYIDPVKLLVRRVRLLQTSEG